MGQALELRKLLIPVRPRRTSIGPPQLTVVNRLGSTVPSQFAPFCLPSIQPLNPQLREAQTRSDSPHEAPDPPSAPAAAFSPRSDVVSVRPRCLSGSVDAGYILVVVDSDLKVEPAKGSWRRLDKVREGTQAGAAWLLSTVPKRWCSE